MSFCRLVYRSLRIFATRLQKLNEAIINYEFWWPFTLIFLFGGAASEPELLESEETSSRVRFFLLLLLLIVE